MAGEFEKCQEMEAVRLKFIKATLFEVHKYLNISQDATLSQIYEELNHTIHNADYEKDLKWWSNNHGVSMAMNWPQFEVNILYALFLHLCCMKMWISILLCLVYHVSVGIH